jgi:hypothetical protein
VAASVVRVWEPGGKPEWLLLCDDVISSSSQAREVGVTAYDGLVATLKDGEELPTCTLIWATGVTGALLEGQLPCKEGHSKLEYGSLDELQISLLCRAIA